MRLSKQPEGGWLRNLFTGKELAHFRDMRVCILSPIMIPEPAWIRCTVNMMAFSWAYGLKIYQMAITERVVVDWARNDLARAALDARDPEKGKKYTHFLWLDADMVFNPELACWLAKHTLAPEVDMVSALYYSRAGPTLPVAYIKDDNPDKYKHYPIIDVPPAMCEVDAVGFGALLMKRSVLERVPEPWFTIDSRGGEDIVFCVHAKQKGVRIFLDGAYKLGHIGPGKIITEKDHKAYMADNETLYADKIKVSMGGKSG